MRWFFKIKLKAELKPCMHAAEVVGGAYDSCEKLAANRISLQTSYRAVVIDKFAHIDSLQKKRTKGSDSDLTYLDSLPPT